MKEEGK